MKLLATFLALPLLAACILGACGGETMSAGPSAGTVAGSTLHVAHGNSVFGSVPIMQCSDAGAPQCASLDVPTIYIDLANRDDELCVPVVGTAESRVGFANLQQLRLVIASDGSAVRPGAYAVVPPPTDALVGPGATAHYLTEDSSCNPVLRLDATGGNVTVASVSPDKIAGAYSVTFGAQGTLSGAFDVALGTCSTDAAPPRPPPDGCHP